MMWRDEAEKNQISQARLVKSRTSGGCALAAFRYDAVSCYGSNFSWNTADRTLHERRTIANSADRNGAKLHTFGYRVEVVHSQHVSVARERGRRSRAHPRRSAGGLEQRQVREPQHDYPDGELWRAFVG